jgi:CubicO group peptidase (beta-lactamase class C family)
MTRTTVARCAFATILAALIATLAACSGAPTRSVPIEQHKRAFDAAFDDVMSRYQLPGLAVGIVRNGEVIYRRTAGELEAGGGQNVTPATLFKIASNSKAMTTGVLARLVDAGKLHWNDPVTRYLPHFRMYDPWVTREMQVRDLLIHNTGLREGAGDLMFWPEPNSFTRADVLAGIAHLKPQHSFRSRYDYDNLMYIVAGEVAAAAAGVTYEELVQRELFGPLGMSRCQVGEWRRDEVGNVAQPHMRKDGRNVVIRRDDEVIGVTTFAAAGGIRCSLDDMLKWVRMWLDPGLKSQRGEPWLSKAQRDVVWSAQIQMPLSERQRRWDGSRFNAYGYGWRLSDVDGVLRVAHTGTLAGMFSAVTLLPEKGVGFVFLINGDGGEARTVLNEVLVKQFTAPQRALPVAHYADELARERAGQPRARAVPDVSARKPATLSIVQPSLGIYLDPWFGEASICERDGRLTFAAAKSPLLTGEIMDVGGRLLVDWFEESVDAEAWLEFRAASAGQPASLALSKVDPEADFSYDYEDLLFSWVRDCD